MLPYKWGAEHSGVLSARHTAGLQQNHAFPPTSLCSIHLFFHPFFPAFYTRKLRLPGPVPTPRAADSALCSGGCSLEGGASLQGWLNALGMLFRQGHTETMPVWAWWWFLYDHCPSVCFLLPPTPSTPNWTQGL